MSERVFINGERIYLRGLEVGDVEGGYVHWFDDGEVCRYNGHHMFPKSKDNLLDFIRYSQNTRDSLVLAIVEKKDDRHIGNISIQSIDYIARNGEFAIIIGEREAWGKGYSKEAGRLIVDHAFKVLNLERVYCGTSEKNIPMQKLALGMGFKEEGRRRKAIFKDGEYLDIMEYGILKEEWQM